MFLSTSEKLGADRLVDELALPPAADEGEEVDEEEDGLLLEDDEDGVVAEEPVELLPLMPLELLLPVAEGVDEVDGLLDDDEDWATASDDSANITAAAVTLRV